MSDETRDGASKAVADGASNAVADLRVGDRLVARYQQGPARPYLGPLMDLRGRQVTRSPAPGADHPHHRGVWFGHRDVDGVDQWTEFDGHGRVVHRGFDDVGPAGFRERLDWLGADGQPALAETRVVRVGADGSTLVVALDLRLRAARGAVTLGEEKDAGLAIRVAPSLGALRNSEGGEGEAGCWGRRARWCGVSGVVDGAIVGVTLVDDPANPGHPTPWHVRDYGLLAANPFLAGPMQIGAGEELAFRYRLLVHEGDAP